MRVCHRQKNFYRTPGEDLNGSGSRVVPVEWSVGVVVVIPEAYRPKKRPMELGLLVDSGGSRAVTTGRTQLWSWLNEPTESVVQPSEGHSCSRCC